MMQKRLLIGFFALFSLFPFSRSDAYVIDFEDLSAGTTVTIQYSALGLEFQNPGQIASSGLYAHSGSNVLADWGDITAIFSDPVLSAGAWFRHLEGVVLDAYDSSNNLVVSAVAGFYDESTWEFANVSYAGGISKVHIYSQDAFHIDDFAFTPSNPVPEPATMLLFGAGLAGLGIMRKRFKV